MTLLRAMRILFVSLVYLGIEMIQPWKLFLMFDFPWLNNFHAHINKGTGRKPDDTATETFFTTNNNKDEDNSPKHHTKYSTSSLI